MQDEDKNKKKVSRRSIYGALVLCLLFFFGDCMVIRDTLFNYVERDYQVIDYANRDCWNLNLSILLGSEVGFASGMWNDLIGYVGNICKEND